MWILNPICSKPKNICRHPIIKVEYSKHFLVVINIFCLNQRKKCLEVKPNFCSLTIKFSLPTDLTPIIWSQCICFFLLNLANLPLFCLCAKNAWYKYYRGFLQDSKTFYGFPLLGVQNCLF